MYERWGSEWMFSIAGAGVVLFALLATWQARVPNARAEAATAVAASS